MKKLLNKAWIGILAVAAVIFGACCSHKNSPKNDDPNQVNNETNDHKLTKAELQERIDEIRARIKEREMSCVYGSPEVMQSYSQETNRLRHEADSLQQVLDNWDKK